MRNEEDYINYFETLATNSEDLQHTAGGKKSFFVMDDPYELDELDEAIRTGLKMPCMVLDLPDSTFSDSASNNLKETYNGQFMILLQANSLLEKRSARQQAKTIGKKLLKTMRTDAVASKRTADYWDFTYNVQCQNVGPICENYVGIMFVFKIISPLSF